MTKKKNSPSPRKRKAKHRRISSWAKKFILSCLPGILSVIVSLLFFEGDIRAWYHHQIDTPSRWQGTWSNNSDVFEYIVDFAELNFNNDHTKHGKIVMHLFVNIDGSVSGEIYKKSLCDINPVTYIFFIESQAQNILNLFIDRVFYIKFLHEGKHKILAKLKLRKDNVRNGILTFSIIEAPTSVLLRDFQMISVDDSATIGDIEEITNYCLQKKNDFLNSFIKNHKP